MSSLDTSPMQRGWLVLRGAALVLLIGAGLASIVASGGGGGPDAFAEPTLNEHQPLVAFTAGGNAVVTYRRTVTRPVQVFNASGDAEIVTVSRYEHALRHYGVDANVLREMKFDLGEFRFDSSDPPRRVPALSAEASGEAVSIHSSEVGREDEFRACRSTTSAPEWACSPLSRSPGPREAALALNGAGAGLGLLNLWDSTTNGTTYSRYERELFSIHRTADGAWSAPRKIGDSRGGFFGGDNSDPLVVFANDGTGHALYVDRTMQLVARRYQSSIDAWQPPATLASSSFEAALAVSKVRLVLHRAAPEAAPIALWLAPTGQRLRAMHIVGNQWVAAPPLPASDCAQDVDAAMAANGDVLAAWVCNPRGDEDDADVYTSRFSAGAWSTPELLGSGANLTAGVRVASDAAGSGTALWLSGYRGSFRNVMTASFTQATGWRKARPIGQHASFQPDRNDFDLAMDDSGRALAVWSRDLDSVNTRLVVKAVGPLSELGVTAPRFVFGGDAFELILNLATATTAGSIALSSDLPAGVLTLPASVDLPAGQRELRLSVPTSTVADLRSGRITATFRDLVADVQLTVLPVPTLQVSVTPASVVGGQAAQLSVTTDRPSPVALTVDLASDNTTATVARTLSIGANSTVASTTVLTQIATVSQIARLTARFRTSSASIALQIDPTPAGVGSLTVGVIGNGRVTSAPPQTGIDCPGDCTESYPTGTVVTLVPTPTTVDSRFGGWSGDPDCADGQVRLDVARTCTATFVAVGWQPHGPDVERGTDLRLAIAIDRSNPAAPLVYAATARSIGQHYDLFVRRYDGLNWTLVGTGPINDPLLSGVVFTPAIAVDASGRVTVAWAENGSRVRVLQWNGNTWLELAANLRVDPNANVFGVQMATAGNQLIVAWLETAGNVQGLGRPVVKRYDAAATPQWFGGPAVLPVQTDVISLRVASDGANRALLMLAPLDPAINGLEGPVRVVREDAFGAWIDACSGSLSRPGSSQSIGPNFNHGFGVARNSAGEPVAIFNNGDAVFAVECRAGAWSGLDGSALGLVPGLVAGETLHGLAVAQGEGAGVGLAFTKLAQLPSGNRQFTTQVLVQNSAGTPLVANGAPYAVVNDGFTFGLLGFLSPTSPVLAGLVLDGNYVARVYRYVP